MATDTATRLLARIKALREAHDLTQEAFAERAGLGYKHYQQVEAGRKLDIRLSTLIKMADGLGVTLRELVDFDVAPAAVAENAGKYASKTADRKSSSVSSPRRSRAKRT